MKLKSLISLSAAAVLSVLAVSAVPAFAQAGPAGKIHGKVTHPTGVPKVEGTVSLSQDNGNTMKYSFPVSATGDFAGEGIAPGTYSVILRMPDTPPGKLVDEIDAVKITAGEDTLQNVDMSRKEYVDKLSPEQRKQLEEFKKRNAEVMKGNAVVKTLNADLQSARASNKAKNYAEAETLMLKDTETNPPSAELLLNELATAQIGLKKWDEASATLQKALTMATAATKPNQDLIGNLHAGLGEVYARTNKPDDAQKEYDLAAKASPTGAAVYLKNETVIFSQVGNSDAQVAAADKAIAVDPNNAILYYLKGQGLASKITVDAKGAYVMPPGCAEAYNKYLELAPNGQFVGEVKGLLAAANTKVESKYKAPKK